MKLRALWRYAFVLTSTFVIPLAAIDVLHFYRAPFFLQEPRLTRPLLSSCDIFLGGGTAHKSFDRHHEKTRLLDLYGPQNLQFLGEGVPLKDNSNPLDQLLITLPTLGTNGTFGTVSIDGDFSIFEAAICLTQNIHRGFFVQCYAPIRHMKIAHIALEDLSPTTGTPNATNSDWQSLLHNLSAITKRYGVTIDAGTTTGIGDITCLVGWTHTVDSTNDVDFIDATVRTGIFIPSDSSSHHAFLPDISTHHWGLPVIMQCALGLFDWLTIGTNSAILWLFDRTRTMPVKTAEQQNGLIKLARSRVHVDPGLVWTVGGYLKADHVLYNRLSFIAGYSFAEQRTTYLSNAALGIANDTLNSDDTLRTWQQHNLHFTLEIDCAHQTQRVYPRISIFYNVPVAGKRVWTTPLIGGSLGADIRWHY